MYKIFLRVILVLFTAAIIFSNTSKNTFRVEEVVGDVYYSTDNGKTWKELDVGVLLNEGNMVKTDRDSSCTIIMPKLGVMKIVENSIITIRSTQTGNESIKSTKGKTYVKIEKKLGKNESFKFHTETAVMAVRGTEFFVVDEETAISTGVNKGEVEVERNLKNIKSPSDSVKVVAKKGQQIDLTVEENRALDNLLASAKNNISKYKAIIASANRDMEKKLYLMKKIDSAFEELSAYSEEVFKDPTVTDEEREELEDVTSSVRDKVRGKVLNR